MTFPEKMKVGETCLKLMEKLEEDEELEAGKVPGPSILITGHGEEEPELG